jgi:L-amino acid N-acyltransferase YncA
MNSANKSLDILIREMSHSDIAAIHSIHTQCLQTTLSQYYTEQQIQAWLAGRTPEGYWRSKEAGSPYLVSIR